MKYADLINPQLATFVNDISNQRMPFESAVLLNSWIEKFHSELTKFHNSRKTLILSHCELDEKNEPILDENGNPTFSESAIKEFGVAMENLLSSECSLYSLPVSCRQYILASSNEIFYLKDLL